MNITITPGADALEMTLTGRLDTATAPDFDAQVAPWLTPDRINNITIDCSGLEYISSAGLRSLIIVLKAAKAAGHTVRLAGVPEQILTILQMTGFTKLFII